MKDIEIKISKESRKVGLSKYVIGNDAENLQGNLVFTFPNEIDGQEIENEFVDGQARLEYIINGESAYIPNLEKKDESYIVPIKSILTKEGQIYMQLVITEGIDPDEIPIFKSNVFYVVVNHSINAEIEQPDEYETWVEIFETYINQIENLNIEIEKVENTTYVTLTKKDGSQETYEIKDGTSNFATFEINDNMELVCYTTDDMYLEFNINDNGELEVLI